VAKSVSWSASRCARYSSTLMAMCGKKESRCAADSRSAGRRVSGRGGLRMATDAFPSFLPAGRHEGRHGSLHGRNTLISQVNSALYGARILSASVSAAATPWRRRTMCTRDFRQDTLGIEHETCQLCVLRCEADTGLRVRTVEVKEHVFHRPRHREPQCGRSLECLWV
jgi:hypothetical protein